MRKGPGRFASTLAVALLLAVGFVALLSAPSSAFGERPYDANTVVGSDSIFLVWSGESVAQSFTPSTTYILLNLTLRLRNLGNAGNTVNVTIQTDAGGVPRGTALAWSNPQAATSVGLVTVPFTPTPTLARGVLYWIVAAKTGALSQAYEVRHTGADVYFAGKAMTNLGVGWTNPATPTDLRFVAYGRELEANVTLAMTVAPTSAQPKDLLTFTLFVNNTGTLPASTVWVNETLPVGLAFVADTSSTIPAITGFPTYGFANLTNGAHAFSITARVDAGVAPGTVLTNAATLASANAAGTPGPPSGASASVTIGLAWKQLSLFPTTPGA